MKRFWGRGTIAGEWVALEKDEQDHARVSRVREGEAVELIDGLGNFWRGSYEKAGVRIKEVGKGDPSRPRLLLAVGISQGGTMDDIMRQATEMGAAEIIPLKIANSAPLGGREQNKAERWQRIAEEACKQCGRYWKPNVWPVTTLKETLSKTSDATHLVAALEKPITPWNTISVAKDSLVIWVGPEGDFSKEEYEQLHAAGAYFVSLGMNVLRVETACVAALARASMGL